MPKITQYGAPQARTQAVRGPRAQGLPATAFEPHILKGAVSLAQGFAQMTEKVNTTSAEEAVIKFERAKNEMFFNPDTGYFNTQGKSAYNMSSDANKSLQKLAQTHGDALSPSAREMFMRVADRHIANGQTDIMRHAGKGLKAWETSTIKAQVENSIENAALFRGDEKKLSVQRELGRQSIIKAAELEGIDPTEGLQTFESAFASATIDAAILDNADAGNIALGKYGDRLEGAEKVKFEKRIEKVKEQEKAQTESQDVVRIANRFIKDYAGNRVEMQEAIINEDPEIQTKLRSQVSYIQGQLDSALTRDRNDVVDMVQKSGSVEEFKATHMDQWDKLTKVQQNALEKGPVKHSWNNWHLYKAMTDEQVRKLKPDEIGKLVSTFDDSHRNTFFSEWEDAVEGKDAKSEARIGQTQSAALTSAIEQIVGKKKKDWSLNFQKRTNLLYELANTTLQNEKDAKGRPLTETEFSDTLNNFQRKMIMEDPWFGAPRLELAEGHERDQIISHLESLGVTDPPEEIILEAYRQATSR